MRSKSRAKIAKTRFHIGDFDLVVRRDNRTVCYWCQAPAHPRQHLVTREKKNTIRLFREIRLVAV